MTESGVLLLRIGELTAQEDWTGAVRVIDELTVQGRTHSGYGVPLAFLRAQAIEARSRAADMQAGELLAQGDAAQAEGNINRARRRYAQALAQPHLTPECEERVRARIERLETQLRNDASDAFIQTEPVGDGKGVDAHTASMLTNLQVTRPEMHRLLALCAIPRWFDADVLRVLRQKDDGRQHEALALLNDFSFIYPWESARYTLSENVREQLLHGWQANPAQYQAVNVRLAHHFGVRLAAAPALSAPRSQPRNPARTERLRQAHLYHTFLADSDVGAALLSRYFQAAEDDRRLVAARQYIIVLQGLRNQISPSAYAHIEYAEGWFHHLQGNESAAHLILEGLNERDDLAPDLAARVTRGLAMVHIARGDWVEGVEGLEESAAAFARLDEPREQAETLGLFGDAYLRIAAASMGEYDPLMEEYTGRMGALSLGALLVRLPLVFYLLIKLGVAWPLPNLLRFGQGMDWIIARLFGDAIVRLRQAERAYAALDDEAGVNRTRAMLGRLYWVLNDSARAVAYLEPLQQTYPEGSFSRAEADLMLGEAYLARARHDEALALLTRALPVFREAGQRARTAQCHNRLGALAELRRDAADAASHYRAALEAWQSAGNDVRVTQMLNRLERPAKAGELPPAATADIQAVSGSVEARVYATRYVHPVSLFYQRTAIIVFALLIGALSVLSFEIQPDIGLKFDLIIDASQLEWMDFRILQQLEQGRKLAVLPSPASLFWRGLLAITSFILFYMFVGAYLVRRLPLASLEESNRERIILDEAGISRTVNNIGERIAWRDLRGAVYSTRRFCREPIDIFSAIGLPARGGRVEISGLAQGYDQLEQQIRGRVAACCASPVRDKSLSMRVTELSISIFCRGWGLVFVGALLMQTVLLLVALRNEAILSYSLLGGSGIYTIADLWNLIELGVALPLVYWLLIQPARYRLYTRDRRSQLPVLLAAAALSALISASPMRMGRPAVLAGVIALFISSFVLYDTLRYHRAHILEQMRKRSRLALLLTLTLLVMVGALYEIQLELRSYHYQAIGYQEFKLTQTSVAAEGPDFRNSQIEAEAEIADLEQKLVTLEEDPLSAAVTISDTRGIGLANAQLLLPEEKVRLTGELELAQQRLARAQNSLSRIRSGYDRAIAAFDESLNLKPDVRAYRFKLNALAYLGRSEGVNETIQQLEQADLWLKPTEKLQLAQTLHRAGFDLEPAVRAEIWRLAATRYAAVAAENENELHTAGERDLFYGALLINQAYPDKNSAPNAARARFEQAGQIFDQTRSRSTRGIFAATGAGSMSARDISALSQIGYGIGQINLGVNWESGKPEDEAGLRAAAEAFANGIKDYPLSAYNGLAWALVYQSRMLPGSCINSFDDPAYVGEYIDLNLQAESALSAALAAYPEGADGLTDLDRKALAAFYRTRAQLRYILANCDEDPLQRFDYREYMGLAAADYERALQITPRADWYRTAGNLRYVRADSFAQAGFLDAAIAERWLAAQAYANGALQENVAYQGDIILRTALLNLFSNFGADMGVADAHAATLDLIAARGGQADNPQFFIEFAQTEYDRNSIPLAKTAVDRALTYVPDSRTANRLAALIYEKWSLLNDNEAVRIMRRREALAIAQHAVAQRPLDADMRLVLGRTYLRLGQIAPALDELEQALQRSSDDPEILYAIAHAYLLNGDAATATVYYARGHAEMRAADMTASSPSAATSITELLMQPGDDARLAAGFAGEIALTVTGQTELAPNDAVTLAEEGAKANELGDEARKKNEWTAAYLQFARATAFLTQAVRLEPLENAYWDSLRDALIVGQNLSQVGSGRAVLTLLVGTLDQDEVTTLHQVAELDLADDKFGLAAAAMERALILDPGDAAAYATLAETYYRWAVYHGGPNRNARYRLARDAYERAQEAGLQHSLLAYYGGRAYFALGEHDTAVTVLEEAVALDPASHDAYSRLGWATYTTGDYARSIQASRQAIAIDADDPREHFNLGLALTALGDGNGATAAYAAGIDAANRLEDEEMRTQRLDEARNDLHSIAADPQNISVNFITMLQAELESSP
ncbi:MAG: tetratricopeptide repeat protein [Caldilineaceae bacterium]|nr:tetratricopeptide repeat protein [Caldilineaceae bacterium]